MTAEVHHTSIAWKKRIIVDTYRQRRTGNIVFRAWRIEGPGDREWYVPYRNPVWLAQHLVLMIGLGYSVEWLSEPDRSKDAARVIDLSDVRMPRP